jgi:chromosome segregation ATPase
MEDDIEGRFNQLEKRVSDGFVRMETLIETLANTCAREFRNIVEKFEAIDQKFEAIDRKFEAIDGRFDTLEGKVDSLARRMDDEVEQRHVLGERVRKLEPVS